MNQEKSWHDKEYNRFTHHIANNVVNEFCYRYSIRLYYSRISFPHSHNTISHCCHRPQMLILSICLFVRASVFLFRDDFCLFNPNLAHPKPSKNPIHKKWVRKLFRATCNDNNILLLLFVTLMVVVVVMMVCNMYRCYYCCCCFCSEYPIDERLILFVYCALMYNCT